MQWLAVRPPLAFVQYSVDERRNVSGLPPARIGHDDDRPVRHSGKHDRLRVRDAADRRPNRR
jgi:hypothetical protein